MSNAHANKQESLAPRPLVLGRPRKTFAEKNPIEFLEGLGLVDPEKAADELSDWSTNRIESLCSDLFDFLEQQRSEWEEAGPPELSPFSCLAGSSIRGDSGCSSPGCRSAKLDHVARFAAMYADRVFLPVPLRDPGSVGHPAGLRSGLLQTVISILELRPLIEKRIVLPTMRLMHYCDECAQAAMTSYRHGEKTIAKLLGEVGDRFGFSYKFVGDEPALLSVEVRGPKEYVEHGSQYRVFLETPPWAKPNKKHRSAVRIPRGSPVHRELVRSLLLETGRDVLFHQQFAPQFNATYLTDLPGEARFLELLSREDDLAIRTARLFANLTHEIPFILDLPIRTILKIREDNPSSFHNYQAALKGIVKERLRSGVSTTVAEARGIYSDILEPALAELRTEAERQRARWARKSMAIAAIAIGAVSLGATGVLQSQQVLALLGGATIKGLADQLGEANTEAATSDRLFFLLRLQRAASKRRAAA